MVPWLSFTALCALVKVRFRWAVALAYFAVAILFFSHHNKLVNEPDLIGRWGIREMMLRAEIKSWQRTLDVVMKSVDRGDPTVYPAGWLTELPFNRGRIKIPILDDRPGPERIRITRLWHSPLTGIFRLERIPLRAWYPGGRLSEGADRIEFRDRA